MSGTLFFSGVAGALAMYESIGWPAASIWLLLFAILALLEERAKRLNA